MFVYLKSLIERKEHVEMIYQSSNGAITQRVLTINEISDKHIKAYCHLRKKIRVFKRENILSIQPYKQKRKYVG